MGLGNDARLPLPKPGPWGEAHEELLNFLMAKAEEANKSFLQGIVLKGLRERFKEQITFLESPLQLFDINQCVGREEVLKK